MLFMRILCVFMDLRIKSEDDRLISCFRWIFGSSPKMTKTPEDDICVRVLIQICFKRARSGIIIECFTNLIKHRRNTIRIQHRNEVTNIFPI